MKKIAIITLAVFTILSSCKKTSSSSDPVYTFKGVLYKDCSKTILANTPVALYDPIIYGGLGLPYSGPTILGADTTDADGNFTIKYKITTGFFPLAHFLVNNSAVLYDVETGKNVDSTVVYKNFTTNVNVSLNVNNPYTSSDTLWVNDLTGNSTNVKIAGPFKSGLLYTANNYRLLMPNYQSSDTSNATKIGYKIANNNWTFSNKVIMHPCTNSNLTITIN